jgi:hypothetical protein
MANEKIWMGKSSGKRKNHILQNLKIEKLLKYQRESFYTKVFVYILKYTIRI